MKSGRLRRRVTIQALTQARSAIGGVTETWADLATVYAAIEPLSGHERVVNNQIQAEGRLKITIRYRADVDPSRRMTYGKRIFDIESVQNLEEKNAWLICFCREDIKHGRT